MKTLDFEKMENLEGGSCLSASIWLGVSILGMVAGAASGVGILAGAACVGGVVAASIELEESC
jgi:formate-dependent nitrite reductase membrane component NrfD